jgi:hypothetical protein
VKCDLRVRVVNLTTFRQKKPSSFLAVGICENVIWGLHGLILMHYTDRYRMCIVMRLQEVSDNGVLK